MSTEKEIELCYYCEIRNHGALEQATSIELQEQYEYRLPPTEDGEKRGRVRVRKSTKNNETSFEECIKIPVKSDSLLGDFETATPISEAYFNAWRNLYKVDGQKKIRYRFVTNEVTMKYDGNQITLPPLGLEVDILISAQGLKSVWAKVDIEIHDVITMLKESYPEVEGAKFEIDFSSLPLNIGQVVSAATKDPQEREAIDGFYKRYAIKHEETNAGQLSN